MDTIIYGTGSFGEKIYHKFCKTRNIVGFCDSDSKKWNHKFLELPIYAPEELTEFQNTDILVASTYFEEIIDKLLELKINRKHILYVNPEAGILERVEYGIGKKQDRHSISRILFVQAVPGIRIDKIAYVLKKKGVHCDLAYLFSVNNVMGGLQKKAYDNIIPINDFSEFVDYVNKETYDIVFSSNEPDYLTSLLINTNKKIVYDVADVSSMYRNIHASDMVHEYIANTQTNASIYVTDGIRKIVEERFNIRNKKSILLNNYVLRSQKPEKYLKKLHETDKEIHCVYEGGLSDNQQYLRYCEKMFLQIAEQKVHVHFYGKCPENLNYCHQLELKSEYLHYEGCIPYEQLQTELTKYDIGLTFLNITEKNEEFLQTTFSNKIFEYLFAELPVAVCNIEITKEFVKQYQVGKYLDFSGNIKEQLEEIYQMKVDRNFLETNGLTMEDQAERILEFLEEV